VLDFEDPHAHFFFKNLLVAPSVTSNKKNNPGCAIFEVNASGVPHNLKYEFIDLDSTYGQTEPPKKHTFNSIDFANRYQLTNIDAQSLADFGKRL
jgi:hypothetical protein